MNGIVDVAGGDDGRPNFQFNRKPFLHFHVDSASGDIYADVKLGGPDFEPVWASSPSEREELLRRVRKHLRRVVQR